MRDTQCHASALHNVVMTSRATLENKFWTFQNFRHDMARTISPGPHRLSTHMQWHEFFPHWHATLRAMA